MTLTVDTNISSEEVARRFKEDVKECLVLTEMAYWGNCDERQALRMIRNKLRSWSERGVL